MLLVLGAFVDQALHHLAHLEGGRVAHGAARRMQRDARRQRPAQRHPRQRLQHQVLRRVRPAQRPVHAAPLDVLPRVLGDPRRLVLLQLLPAPRARAFRLGLLRGGGGLGGVDGGHLHGGRALPVDPAEHVVFQVAVRVVLAHGVFMQLLQEAVNFGLHLLVLLLNEVLGDFWGVRVGAAQNGRWDVVAVSDGLHGNGFIAATFSVKQQRSQVYVVRQVGVVLVIRGLQEEVLRVEPPPVVPHAGVVGVGAAEQRRAVIHVLVFGRQYLQRVLEDELDVARFVPRLWPVLYGRQPRLAPRPQVVVAPGHQRSGARVSSVDLHRPHRAGRGHSRGHGFRRLRSLAPGQVAGLAHVLELERLPSFAHQRGGGDVANGLEPHRVLHLALQVEGGDVGAQPFLRVADLRLVVAVVPLGHDALLHLNLVLLPVQVQQLYLRQRETGGLECNRQQWSVCVREGEGGSFYQQTHV